jgi:hypothetical protein
MSDRAEPAAPRRGAVDPAVAAELPGLRLHWLAVAVAPGSTGRSRAAPVQRLRALSDRYRGATVIAMRTQPIPRAYRTFYRQIGLDPDVERIPSEQAATERLLQGGWRSTDGVSDACLVAVVETGVPVWALDAAAVDSGPPGLGIGLTDQAGATPGSLVVCDRRSVQAGATPGSLVVCDRRSVQAGATPGSLVVCDRRSVHAPLFGTPLPGHAPGPSAPSVVLYALGVAGVPHIHIDEALWTAAGLLGEAQ